MCSFSWRIIELIQFTEEPKVLYVLSTDAKTQPVRLIMSKVILHIYICLDRE